MSTRWKIGLILAGVATACSVIGFAIPGGDYGELNTLMIIGVIVGIISYVFGGFGTAVRMAWSIAKWGWCVVSFPYDLLTGAACFFVSILVFCFVPIIPMYKAYKESTLY